MLVIRFLRTGKKNQPFFRIVVTDKKNPPRGGRFLEILGFFNPLTKEKSLKEDRIKHWLSVGAQPSARVHNLLIEEKIIEGKKIDVHPVRKSKKEKETPKAVPEKEELEKPTSEKGISNGVHKKPKKKEKPKEEKPKETPKEEVKKEAKEKKLPKGKPKEEPAKKPEKEKPEKPVQPLDK